MPYTYLDNDIQLIYNSKIVLENIVQYFLKFHKSLDLNKSVRFKQKRFYSRRRIRV